MLVGLLKLRPGLNVAAGAFRVYYFVPARGDRLGIRLMNRMARHARNLVPAVAALDAAGMSKCVLVAGKADGFRLHRPDFRWIYDIWRGCRFRVLGAWSVAGFTCLPLPFRRARLYGVMAVPLKSIKDVFVASLAGV
jgi:hypothetical protein